MLATETAGSTDLDRVAHRLLSVLPERERYVLDARYGLGGKCPQSLREVGTALRVSREWVRVLEARALRTLARAQAAEHVRVRVGRTCLRLDGIARLDRLMEEVRGEGVSITNEGCVRLLLAMEGGRCVVRSADMELWGLAGAPLRFVRPLCMAAASTLRTASEGMSIDRLVDVLRKKVRAPALDDRFVEAAIRATSRVSVQDDGWCRYRRRTTRTAQLKALLREQGGPLHLKEIQRALLRDTADSPSTHALYECLRRQKSVFLRVAPATFALRGEGYRLH